jgi:hypothetical protein
MTVTDPFRRTGWLLVASAAIAATLAAVDRSSWLITPFGSTLKLVTAALIGLVITSVQRQKRGDRLMSSSMEQAQILLAVCGALMMIIVGDSLARAFGLVGAASVVRFRTPVEDPRDVTVLFLLMGLGMACGLGALTTAGLGALFLAICLVLLSRLDAPAERAMKVALTADGPTFPVRHVEDVFASHRIVLEPLECTHGDLAIMRYRARLPRDQSIQELSTQLMNGGTMGIKSVTWEAPKKNG